MTNNLAGFRLRLLASFIDGGIFLLPHTLFSLFISQSNSLAQFSPNLMLYFIVILLPLLITTFLYSSLLTHYFGGALGKLITGLRVISENGQRLSLKRSLFRHTIGYQFSNTFFGLGYFWIIKDKNKMAWHDYAVGSKVIITKPFWPLALFILILLWVLNIYLAGLSINNFKKGSLISEVSSMFQSLEGEVETQKEEPEQQLENIDNLFQSDTTPSNYKNTQFN